MRVVIRSDPHKKMNEYVEKYSYLSTKPWPGHGIFSNYSLEKARITLKVRMNFDKIMLN